MKRSLLFAALVIATASFGDTFRTNDVEGLVHLLKTYNGTGHTIELESGDYNLTEECSWYTNSSAYASHLYLTKTCLKGVGDSRESVKLIGDGSLRIIYGDAESTVANLMITNGYAAVVVGYSNSGRGGGVSGGLAVTNCLITGNIAQGHGGGAYQCKLYESEISFNTVESGWGGGAHSATLTNCTVYANVCSRRDNHAYGGGLAECSAAYNCKIYGNYAKTLVVDNQNRYGLAGGVYLTKLYDCHIHDNYSDSHGGGVRGSTLVRCTVYKNYSGGYGWNAYGCNLIDCDVSYGTVYGCTASGSKFHDIGGEVILNENPYKTIMETPTVIMNGYVNMTNCLFTGNGVKNGNNNITFFQYATAEKKPSTLVNCTIVSNIYASTFTFAQAEYPIKVVNCVFSGNEKRDGSKSDISMEYQKSKSACAANSVYFQNCAYGIRSTNGNLDWSIYPQESTYVFGDENFGDDPKFQHHRDAEHPFSLRRTSPLIGKGRHEPWMDTATDLRGEGFARANGKSVDIGCYQCWLNPAGTVFSIR